MTRSQSNVAKEMVMLLKIINTEQISSQCRGIRTYAGLPGTASSNALGDTHTALTRTTLREGGPVSRLWRRSWTRNALPIKHLLLFFVKERKKRDIDLIKADFFYACVLYG